MPNPVVKFQLVVGDPARAAAFYRDLFDWTVRGDDALGYRELCTGDARGIDGGIWPSPEPQRPPMVQLFIEVPDIDAHLARAEALGAQLVIPRTPLPDGDVIAVILDPCGVALGLMEPRATG
jgi:uncharacterized protein